MNVFLFSTDYLKIKDLLSIKNINNVVSEIPGVELSFISISIWKTMCKQCVVIFWVLYIHSFAQEITTEKCITVYQGSVFLINCLYIRIKNSLGVQCFF